MTAVSWSRVAVQRAESALCYVSTKNWTCLHCSHIREVCSLYIHFYTTIRS